MPFKQNQKGFTLIETLMAIFVFVTLAYGVFLLYSNLFSTTKQQGLLLGNVDQARTAAFNFANEIRNATYGNDGSYPVNQAGDNQIIFYSSYGASANSANRVRYYVSNGNLYKGVISPQNNVYNGNEVVSLVLSNIKNGATPEFYYLDGSNAQLTQPVNLNQVKFVKINLVVPNPAGPSTNATFPISAGAAIRNLKTNLGN